MIEENTTQTSGDAEAGEQTTSDPIGSTKVAELEAVISGMEKQLASISSERDSFKTKLSETLEQNRDSIKNASDHILKLKEDEWSKTLNETKNTYEAQLEATTKELHKLKIESQVTSSGISWRPEAIELVKREVNSVAKIDQKTGNVTVEGGGDLTSFLKGLAEKMPFLVASKASGGIGSGSDSETQSNGKGANLIPEDFESWTSQERRKFMRENPEAFKQIKKQLF